LNICSGQSVTLTATGQGTFTWSGGVSNGVAFTPSTTGTYTVTAIDANGCTNTDQIVVNVTQTPTASFTADTLYGNPGLTVNFTNTSSNATSFDWDFGNGNGVTVNNLSGQTETYDAIGSYTVELTAFNGACFDTETIIINVIELPDVVIYVPNVTTLDGNAVNDFWYIDVQNAKSINVQIFNRWGNLMAELDDLTDKWDGTVNGNPVSEGTYFYKYRIIDLFDKEHTGHGHFTVIDISSDRCKKFL
jgi:gliding motility-associated-like protein